ncbi:MAG TPA: hypothetical protein VIM57_06030 [Luteolibacter sp.]
MISFHRTIHLLISLSYFVALSTLYSCASHPHVIRVVSQKPDYVVKEVRITGRAIMAKSDFYSSLQIEGFKKPDGELYRVESSLTDEVLRRKLDLLKPYRFLIYTTEQTLVENRRVYHAILSKVEDGHATILDASICDVHRCPMDFVEAVNVDWQLKSKQEKHDLKVYRNHGFAFPSCCSGGMIHWWTWRCPQCANKVDAFKSKFEP